MAQIISYYSAAAGGSSTMYYYQYADDTSKATRIYTGTAITLPADFGSHITNHMYPLRSPGGWMFWYHVQNITPVYITVTDACTAPEAVVLDAEKKVLTITGGEGGDLNAWSGFGVSWRERRINSAEWGEWSADIVVAERTVNVETAGGMVRQYRVRTLGEAGESYYSDYTVCETLLNGNTAAGTPVVLLPVSGMDTCASEVRIKIECPPEPDGDAMILQRSMDGGAWTDALSLSGEGGAVYDTLSVGEGTHTVRYRLMDTGGESEGEDGITFACVPHVWRRAIQPGDVIANREISFVADINELLMLINRQRAFYGLGNLALPGTAGRAADWQRQLGAMQTALDECRSAAGRKSFGFLPASGWPDAQQINQLRAAVENT